MIKLKKILNIMKNFIIKYYKILLPITILIVITIVITLLNNNKLKPIIKIIELGDIEFDITDVNNFFPSNDNLNDCHIESKINVNKVGKYKYSIVCSNKTYGPYKIEVKDTTPPSTIIKKLTIFPGTKIEEKDLFLSVSDISSYKLKFEDIIDTNYEGIYDVNITVTDKYGNSKTVTPVLTISEDSPVKTLKCSGLVKIGMLPSTYEISLDSSNHIFNVLRITNIEYDNKEYYYEDKNNYFKTNLISGYNGEAVFDNEKLTTTIFKYILDIDYKDEFNIKYQLNTKADVLKLFGNKCVEE